MILQIPNVLTPEQVADFRKRLDTAEWIDGKATAGGQAIKTKDNLQLDTSNPTAIELGNLITQALSTNPLFVSAALPLRVLPPMFNKYTGGGTFGTHVDNAIRYIPGTGQKMRTDLSATLFFSDPDEYEGGVLTIEDTYGTQEVKLPAGHMILYPATSLHRVTPVTSGARVSSFFWIQSMVRDDTQRGLLFDLDCSIQRISQELGEHAAAEQSAVQLTGIYHNLIRQWAEV
ncbi:PKHD-type hydroxylase [Rubritalea squalenifaciens DSM 18772]|uniref:PKHD-type hydroxylase n=1 Tax=Rubritalea squalenifaciens DSM 18772 TaxID=1123071 RepID=A0A1M6P5A0_9BACT|nr:Fe2+-dependent dioxygenase [Rubritalea squalenifaciens]SHK03072.1 PKHD-type hydroxylase [Rubritalea squalenifaciens DSM 18772]